MRPCLLAGLSFSVSALGASADSELLKEAKLTKTQAEKIALAKVPHASIQSAEIEREQHALVWSFDLVTSGSKNITEVLVNAKPGKVISVSTETPKDQAKGKAEDQAHARN